VAPPLVLHVLPVDLARGAQTYARDLRHRLDREDTRHRCVTIFRSGGSTLLPDYRLDVPDGALRARGFDPRAVPRFRSLLRALRPAVVVAHGAEPLKYAVLAGVPSGRLVYYRIGIGSAGLRGVRRGLYKMLFRRPCIVAAVSGDVAREVLTYGVDERRVRVIPNSRDAAHYGAVERTASPAGVRLAFVGRLIESKRPLRFVELVRALRDNGVQVGGVLAGTGPLFGAVCDASRDLPIDVLGEVDDVRSVFAEADVFVFTSVEAGEGMPGVLIEAGMAALPIVTTRVPGAADVVEDGRSGFVVPVHGMDPLVDATRRLIDEPETRAKMGSEASALCEERFGVEKNMEQWRTLLDDLLDNACEFST
jgi:glycosyltransferase involved in cell wall biosynthesis